MHLACDEFIKVYWSHYVTIEKEYCQTMQYVAVDSENKNTFSTVYAKLLLAIGSEVDITAKLYCSLLKPGFKKDKLFDYMNCICLHKAEFPHQSVSVVNTELLLHPWHSWSLDQKSSPTWWTVYNKNKHERFSIGEIDGETREYYKFANQGYTMESLAGLYQLLMCVYLHLAIREERKVKTPLPGARLFRMIGSMWTGIEVYSSDYAFYVDDSGCLIQAIGPYLY